MNNKEKTLSFKLKGYEYLITTPKTRGSIRDVKMPNVLIDILKEHKARCKDVYLFSDDFFINGGVVPIKDTTIDNFKKECIKEASVKYIRMHDFRHSHASLLINNGVNISVVSKRLGHSSIKETLDTYSHMYEEKEDEAIKLLNEL